MKSIAKLIKKEKLRSNYKLTFNNNYGILYLVLHKTQQAIFTNLSIGVVYSFFYFRGLKNYYFIKPQSIKETRQTSFVPIRKINIKNMFVSMITKNLNLKTRELSPETIQQKLNQL